MAARRKSWEWRHELWPQDDAPLLPVRVGDQVLRKTPGACTIHIVQRLTGCTLTLDNGERFWRVSGKLIGSYYQKEPVIIEPAKGEVAEAVESRTLLAQIRAFCESPSAVYADLKDLRRAHALTVGKLKKWRKE